MGPYFSRLPFAFFKLPPTAQAALPGPQQVWVGSSPDIANPTLTKWVPTLGGTAEMLHFVVLFSGLRGHQLLGLESVPKG